MSRIRHRLWREVWFNPGLAQLIRALKRSLAGCQTALDVGCGSSSPLRFLTTLHLTGLDAYAPAIQEARERDTHDELVVGDVRRIRDLFAGRRFDACVGLDVIEHLPKDDGWQLLDDLEQLATRRVVILTPNGFLPQRSRDGDLQEHLSGWTAEEMRQRGYQVIGLLGLKSLRGEYHQIKYEPRVFWALVSMLTHCLYTRARPEKAAAIFCVKALTD
jgi:SAM-dependent methyltransferase